MCDDGLTDACVYAGEGRGRARARGGGGETCVPYSIKILFPCFIAKNLHG